AELRAQRRLLLRALVRGLGVRQVGLLLELRAEAGHLIRLGGVRDRGLRRRLALRDAHLGLVRRVRDRSLRAETSVAEVDVGGEPALRLPLLVRLAGVELAEPEVLPARRAEERVELPRHGLALL